jgi:hypothetical protein
MAAGVRYKKVPLAEGSHTNKVRGSHAEVAEGFQVLNLQTKYGIRIHSVKDLCMAVGCRHVTRDKY